MWCVAELNEDYIAKMEDVLETYEQPYDPKHPVVCLDEKPVTLHADVRPASPAEPGREARRDSEYERCGTANVFCAVEPKAGRHFTFPTPDRSAFEFARVAFHLAIQYPPSVICQSPTSGIAKRVWAARKTNREGPSGLYAGEFFPGCASRGQTRECVRRDPGRIDGGF